jgi:hypothetical protein
MYESGVSVIVYVSLIDTYTMTDTHDWYIHYRWQTWFIHTLWLIYLIDTYTMTDTPDSYIHYRWHTWFIHSAPDLILLIWFVGVTLWFFTRNTPKIFAPPSAIGQNICIHYDWNTWLIHILWLTHLIDSYTMTDTHDWYIHYRWHTWFIHKWMYHS